MAYFEFRTNAMYVQGADALAELKRYSFHLGTKFLIALACGPVKDEVLAKVEKSFENSMESNVNMENRRAGSALALAKKYDEMDRDIAYKVVDCDGQQVTLENIEALTKIAREFGADCIIGIGGGKILDMVRGVYHKIGYPIQVVLCPTATATNAPASMLTVLYDDEGQALGVWSMPYHPALVLCDTAVTSKAPWQTLVAGMGDCMGTYYEGLQAIKETNAELKVMESAWAATHAVKDTFFEHGYQAMLAAKNNAITYSYETVVSQIVHTSGPMSNAVGIHYPHIIDELIINYPQCTFMLHGMLVGYGVIPYLIWANYPLEDIYEYIDWASSVGIPVTFEDLGIADEPVEKLYEYGERAACGPTAMLSTASGKLTGRVLAESMLIAQDLVVNYLSGE